LWRLLGSVAPGMIAGLEDLTHPGEITDEYDVGETLGTGHFSKVKLGVHKVTKEQVAIKIINKPTGSKIAMLKAEVDILIKCDHPNVVKLYKVYETPQILYLVMEILSGGELFDRIISKGHYSEEDARQLSKTLCESISYLHSLGIAHRDLKPENILLKDTTEAAMIKITDFGLSKIFADDAAGEVVMRTACGTPGYVAPEVLTHDAYSEQVDMWSLGVIVYILLCGFPPFYGDNDAQMFKKIKAANYKFLQPYWDEISEEAKDFVRNLLIVDPTKRMTAEKALQHTWLTHGKPSSAKKNLMNREDKKHAPGSYEEELDEGSEFVSKFNDFNLNRKTSVLQKFIKNFDLAPESQKLGKFKCSLSSKAGHLYICTHDLCFLSILGKKYKIPLSSIKEISKQKRFKLTPGAGHSLHIVHIVNGEKSTHEFHGFANRELCIQEISAACNAQKLPVPAIR